MKNAKRIISLITVLAMIAVMFSAVGFNTAAEDITYIGRTSPEAYAWLENADGVRDDTLVIADAAVDNQPGGKKIKNAQGEFVSGAMVFRFTDDAKNLSIQAGYSTSDWLGRVTVEASADGKNFTPVEITLISQSGYYWGGALVYQNDIYTSANDFTADQHIRYIKVNVPCNTQFAAPGLTSISYNTYGDVLEEYDATVTADKAVATEGELIYGGPSFSSDFYYFNPSGSVTFSSANYAPITDFSARVLLHNPYMSTSLIAQVSSDGINFSNVSLAFKNAGLHNPAWDCDEYDVYGSFSADDNIRYVRFKLTNTITCAAGIRNFSCNEADVDIIYCNSFDIANGTTTDGNVITASPAGENGYLLTKGGSAVSGSMIYYDEDGITNFSAEYAQVFGIYGEISIWASVDGSDWVPAPGADTNTGVTYAGDQNCHRHVYSGTLSPSAGYKYIKVQIESGEADQRFPAVFSIRYNKASQLGRVNPSEPTSELKESYDVTLSANDESIVKTPDYEGAVFSSASVATGEIGSDYYAFYQGGASRSGRIDIYSGGVITDFSIDAFAGNMNMYNGQLSIYVSSDGETWMPTAPAGNVAYDERPSWGDLWGRSFYGTLKENENIHYIRIVYTSSWLAFIPAVRSISYNYVSVEDSCDDLSDVYEISVNATDAEVTPYVEGSQYREADAQIPSFYAFFDESGAWQPGEIVFTSESAITEYKIDAFSGNTPNFGMLKFSASSDGINYVDINPSKYTYDTRGGWADMAGNYFYGKLLASADIHYIKIEYAEKGTWIQFAPAVRMLSYNTVDSCDSIGHNYVISETVPATCTEDGYTEYVCSHCGDVKTESIAATGHKFTNYVSDGNVTPTTDGTKTATCDNGCGATDTVVDEGSRLVCVDEEIADFDNDGEITAVDYTTMRKNLMSGISGDVNGDGVTDILDLIRFKNYLLSVADGPIIDAGGSTDTPSNMD